MATKNELKRLVAMSEDAAVQQRRAIVAVPKHWPARHNACTDPCDMLQGPCACGAYHSLDEDWVLTGLKEHGIIPKR